MSYFGVVNNFIETPGGEIAYFQSVEMAGRAFLFGDGFFETLKGDSTGIYLWENHLRRLAIACELTGIEQPMAGGDLKNLIHDMVKFSGFDSFRVKIHVSRIGGGTYLPKENGAVLAVFMSGDPNLFDNTKPVIRRTVLYPHPVKLRHPLSAIKTTSCIYYTMAIKWAVAQGYNDAVLLNDSGNPAEFTSSNIYLYQDGSFVTPPLNESCVDGVMRSFILSATEGTAFRFTERKITTEELESATFLFSSNAGSIALCSFADKIIAEPPEVFLRLQELLKQRYFERKSRFDV